MKTFVEELEDFTEAIRKVRREDLSDEDVARLRALLADLKALAAKVAAQ